MKDADISTIGGRIRKARVNCRLTTRELAELVGVSQNYLSVVERNDRKQASPALMQRIADATGVSLEWIKDGAVAATEKASCADDVSLLLTLIMHQGASITKETVATVLDVNTETVDGILSGRIGYNPRWENGLLNLVQRLDLQTVRKKLRNLDALFQQEDEKKFYAMLSWSLQEYLTREYKATFRSKGKPELIPDDPSYIFFELQREDSPETWNIRYYPSVYEEFFDYIVNQAESDDPNIVAGVAFTDEDAFNKMSDFYEKTVTEMEHGQNRDLERGMPCSPIEMPSIMLFLVDGGTVKMVELSCDPYDDFSDDD